MKTMIKLPQGEVEITEELELPDRAFRDAWQLEGEVVSIDLVKAGAIQRENIKTEAGRRIEVIAPEWKQRNGSQRATELIEIRLDRAWTVVEQAEADYLRNARDNIKAIRDKSDTLEALTDAELIALNVADDASWAVK